MKRSHEEKYLTKPYDIDSTTMSAILNHFNQNQNNINIGSGTQINTQSGDITSYQTITNIFDLEQIGALIFEKNFPKIKEMISEVARANAMNFISELIKQGKEKLSQEDIPNLSDPDLHYMLTQAVITTGRNNDPTLRTHLARLMIDRIKNAKSDLKKIVYNEAIMTLPKLTLNQLKIITACFLLRNARFSNVKDEITFEEAYRPIYKDLLNFHETNAEIQHTVYSGTASRSIGQWNFKDVLRSYSGLNVEAILKTPTGTEFIEFLEKSALTSLTVTSVGIVIATMYYESISGTKVDIDIFIN